MDEMRQLFRILLRIFPQTAVCTDALAGAGDGNRVCEQKIKEFLKRILSPSVPQPEWGVPDGWAGYLAGVNNSTVNRIFL
jgi:hypothetical protein